MLPKKPVLNLTRLLELYPRESILRVIPIHTAIQQRRTLRSQIRGREGGSCKPRRELLTENTSEFVCLLLDLCSFQSQTSLPFHLQPIPYVFYPNHSTRAALERIQRDLELIGSGEIIHELKQMKLSEPHLSLL